MNGDEGTFSREDIEEVLRAFEDRDTATAAAAWAEAGVFVDPHYPEPEYRGPEQVREALDWALDNVVEQPGLAIRNLLTDDGAFAVEVDTHHVTHDDSVREFRQVFIVESEAGEITRWQAYLPFPPPSTE
jgi:ketosteroid isomerase-like protein